MPTAPTFAHWAYRAMVVRRGNPRHARHQHDLVALRGAEGVLWGIEPPVRQLTGRVDRYLYDLVVRQRDDLGLWRRAVLMVFGLFLSAGLNSSSFFSQLLGLFGLLVFVAALGLVELAMALWYREQRRHAQPH